MDAQLPLVKATAMAKMSKEKLAALETMKVAVAIPVLPPAPSPTTTPPPASAPTATTVSTAAGAPVVAAPAPLHSKPSGGSRKNGYTNAEDAFILECAAKIKIAGQGELTWDKAAGLFRAKGFRDRTAFTLKKRASNLLKEVKMPPPPQNDQRALVPLQEEEDDEPPRALPAPSAKRQKPAADLKRPPVPDLDCQEARILFRNASLVKHLRTHPLGDWVNNPHRKVAGKETLAKTKETAADAIKGVIREWLLTTPQGRRALAAADVGEGELSIDRIIPRHQRGGMGGLNCIYNLYLMPVRHNTYFGAELTAEKREYVGKLACKLAKAAHDAFKRDNEGEYGWDVGFYNRAGNMVMGF